MHLLAREIRTLDENAPAQDLGQTPADVVILSFSDADLGALASAWQSMDRRPSLRLANLARLRHPLSVDLYLEQVAAHARCVIVRLLGGLDYWRYGAEELAALCRSAGIPLALLPGEDAEDARLAAMSTVSPDAHRRLHACFRHGGPANGRRLLAFADHLAGRGPDTNEQAEPVPQCGVHGFDAEADRPRAALVFYRSHLLSGDIAPVSALIDALHARGIAVGAFYVASLKNPDCAAFAAETLRAWRPAVVLNATSFSARREAGGSALDAADTPVLQVVLSGSPREAWLASSRGLSQTDLAMQVVLPELDGRLLTTAVSFKSGNETVPELEFAPTIHRPDPEGVALAADRAAGWVRLAGLPRPERRMAIVLSDYPGVGGQRGHAVGLDSFASVEAILGQLRLASYAVGTLPDAAALQAGAPIPAVAIDTYRRLFATLPATAQARIRLRWGDPAAEGGWFAFRHVRCGNAVVALQPDRGDAGNRRAAYHDPDEPPCHAYVAFYLWLREELRVAAIVHLGTHGSLEWLPGKAAALAPDCFPRLLTGGVPVIYPFIVNNPGEAAAAKRRLGAVTIGHMTPPVGASGLHGEAAALEQLIDEYAAADGLDRRRTALLRRDILERAGASGLLAESGVAPGTPDDDAMARLDAYLCDVKDVQLRDGLHVFGVTGPTACAQGERRALLAALDGRFVPPGPAGAPTRGRLDVLPTGRNLTTVDPRMVPTRSAWALASKAAAALLLRHRQDHGEWPRTLVVDLWGSTTIRTGGEDFALALMMLGVEPQWDGGSARVNGFEVLPVARLERPRVDVTLRISGLFRDAFDAQVALFDAAVRAVAARDEAAGWNPLATAARGLTGAALRRATVRVYGPEAGRYGAAAAMDGAAWRAASAGAYGIGLDGAADEDGLAARVREAEAFVHVQDYAEIDLLDSTEHAAHEGGFAAAATGLGAMPALYHLDTSRPGAPQPRTVAEEIARVVRGRAANPRWIAGMMRHGYRGAAEITRSVEALAGFAATLPTRFDRQFDLLFDATVGNPSVDAFLAHANPEARAAMRSRFAQMQARGLWHPRRNAAVRT